MGLLGGLVVEPVGLVAPPCVDGSVGRVARQPYGDPSGPLVRAGGVVLAGEMPAERGE
ncbi:hypothetical protein AB0O76_25770 [Streptomyces sp. NPDC086554]|uniref:hypothetical protein n=1 Tax=Streptomyces sp. NPDC086554 TaxID=3154864 RepID=UPI0034236B79